MAVVNNAINNKVGASNSGATNTLTVDNASNTASSQAQLNITVGGTSSGDAYETFTVAGTTNWSQGIDNSVTGDPFVLSASTALGTTNVESITTGGVITNVLQPAIRVYLSANISNATGDGTQYTIVFNTEATDQGSNFTANTFTAPTAGFYDFTICVGLGSLGALFTSVDMGIIVNASNQQLVVANPGIMRDAANNLVLTGNIKISLAANDTVVGYVKVSGSTKTITVQGGSGSLASYLFGAKVA